MDDKHLVGIDDQIMRDARQAEIIRELAPLISMLRRWGENLDNDHRIFDEHGRGRRFRSAIDHRVGFVGRRLVDPHGRAVRHDVTGKRLRLNGRQQRDMRRELDLPMRGPFRRLRDNLAANEFVPPRPAFGPGEKLLHGHARRRRSRLRAHARIIIFSPPVIHGRVALGLFGRLQRSMRRIGAKPRIEGQTAVFASFQCEQLQPRQCSMRLGTA